MRLEVKFRAHFASIRAQMVSVFIACSLIISVLIAAVCIRVIYTTMEQQATAALVDVTGKINMEIQIMVDDATRLLRWGDVSVVTDFFYAKDRRHKEASAIVAAFQSLRAGQMIGKSVQNVYLFDTDGYGYSEKAGLFHVQRDAR